jgi:hypothetical protein
MHREVAAEHLINYFQNLDKRLLTQFYAFTKPSARVHLVAMGGTALELLGLKDNSKDIDVFIDITSVENLCQNEQPEEYATRLQLFIKQHFDESEGIGADVSYEGLKSWNLLGFQIKTYPLPKEFTCLKLSILDPLDICITKLARYNGKDKDDIISVLLARKPKREELEERLQAYVERLKDKRKLTIVQRNFQNMIEALSRI